MDDTDYESSMNPKENGYMLSPEAPEEAPCNDDELNASGSHRSETGSGDHDNGDVHHMHSNRNQEEETMMMPPNVFETRSKNPLLVRGAWQWMCNQCPKTYTTKNTLIAHLLDHCGIKPHMCMACGKSFKQVAHLNTHRVIHTGRRKHVCAICGRGFNQRVHLKRHMVIHNINVACTCELCGRKFAFPSELQAHHKKVHRKRPGTPKKIVRGRGSEDMPYMSFTGRTPPMAPSFRVSASGDTQSSVGEYSQQSVQSSQGERGLHMSPPGRIPPPAQPFNASASGDTQSSVEEYSQQSVQSSQGEGSLLPVELFQPELVHPDASKAAVLQPEAMQTMRFQPAQPARTNMNQRLMRSRQFPTRNQKLKRNDAPLKPDLTCKDCGRQFAFPFELRDHIARHKDVRPYVCSECGHQFFKEHHLKQHQLIHSGLKPHTCPVCGRAFALKANMQRHTKLHVSGRQYKCKMCDKSFTQKQTLSNHMVIHKDVKPFSCTLCGKTFSRKINLDSHAFLHFGNKPFKCSICGSRYNNKGNLRRHVKNKHGVDADLHSDGEKEDQDHEEERQEGEDAEYSNVNQEEDGENYHQENVDHEESKEGLDMDHLKLEGEENLGLGDDIMQQTLGLSM